MIARFMMWNAPRMLYRDISETVAQSANQRSPGWVTRISAALIFVLVANHLVRFSRADAFARKRLPPATDLARKPSRGTTRALKRSGDGPDSQSWDQNGRYTQHPPYF
ncbi:hypothetical protein [Agrobacterium burrii]|uniref:Uncharacterized protein n=1 Tax=Agrobacterium burrii TaxID=2815339 RepID=A0ABS3EM16_9HYPH|nr:hypothetical protein [Agrobacterium burrii]MBO0132941.1 hypothetical protein [Agrobacterium burrii]